MQTNKEGIIAMGLFDGLAGLHVALNNLGIPVKTYFSSEIVTAPKLVARKNHPGITDIGDVQKVNGHNYPRVDIMGVGSPCQDLSQANTSGKGLDGEKSGLFYDAIRLIRENKPKNIIFENVVPSDRMWIDVMTREINDACRDAGIIDKTTQIFPIRINSNLFGAQTRNRIYWTNLPIGNLPKGNTTTFGDIEFDPTYKQFTLNKQQSDTKYIRKGTGMGIQWDSNGKNNKSQWDRGYFKEQKIGALLKRGAYNMNICVDYDNDIYRKLHPIEGERLQGLPDNYTLCDGVSENQRFEMIGNGWDIKVIEFLLSNLKNKL